MSLLSPSGRIKFVVTGARGPSFADIARANGSIGGQPVSPDDTDQQILDKQTAAAQSQAVAASLYAATAQGFVSGLLYPTTTAGLAATAANGYFTVVGDGTNTYAILYQKVSNEAVEKARYASKAAYEGATGSRLIGFDPLGTALGQSAYDKLAALPSLLDAFASTTQAQIRAGTYTGDLGIAMRNIFGGNQHFKIPQGVFPFTGDKLEITTPGLVVAADGGILKRLGDINGIGLLVTAANVTLDGLKMDGTATQPESYFINDLLRLQGDGGCTLRMLELRGSSGGNLAIQSPNNEIDRIIATDAYDNNIICIKSGNKFSGVRLARTVTQNNMFVTASSGSTDNGEFINNVHINDLIAVDSADSGHEFGYGVQDSTLRGFVIINPYNPGVLFRDTSRCVATGGKITVKPYSQQKSNYDAIAVITAFKGSMWQSDAVIDDIDVYGRVKRALVLNSQSDVYHNVRGHAYITGTAPLADGSDLTGYGMLMPEPVKNISGSITSDGYLSGMLTNFTGDPITHENIDLKIKATRCGTIWDATNTAFFNSRIEVDGSYRIREGKIDSAFLAPIAGQPTSKIKLRYKNLGCRPDPLFTGSSRVRFNDGANAVYLLDDDADFIWLPAGGQVPLMVAQMAQGDYHCRVVGTNRAAVLKASGAGISIVRDSGSDTFYGQDAGSGIQITFDNPNGTMLMIQRDTSAAGMWVYLKGRGIA